MKFFKRRRQRATGATGFNRETGSIVYTCPCCGKQETGLPALTYKAPDYYLSIPADERNERCFINSDLCSVDDEHYFVRAVLIIPILESEETLEWGVWSSLSEANFDYYRDNFHRDPPADPDPLFSWFSSDLHGYESTLGLKSSIWLQPDRQRPLVNFHECDHQVYHDQVHGVSIDRALQLAEPFLKHMQH